MTKLKKSLEEYAEESKSKYRAKAVRYEPTTRTLHVQTERGEEKTFDIDLLQGVSGASDKDAANIEVLGAGTGLHWPNIDASLLVHELCLGIYGTKRWMERLETPVKN